MLDDAAALEELLRRSADASGATVLTGHHPAFEPQGATAVVVLAESHVSTHTCPQWGGATLDAFTCGSVDPEHLIELIIVALEPAQIRRATVPRTVLDDGIAPVFQFAEFITPADRYEHDLEEIYVQGRSAFQGYLIGRSQVWGRMLVLDGVVQSTEGDEFTYHEGIVHPALYAAANDHGVRDVLVLGGGEGACLREVLRWSTVESVTMIDIDDEVVAACRRFLPNHHRGAFDDPRVSLHHMDAVAYLAALPDACLDVVVSDMTDPVEEGPSTFCFTAEYFQQIKRVLRPHGVVAVQAGPSSPVEIALHAKVIRTLQSVFPSVIPYSVDAPCYGRDPGFVIASGQDLRSRLSAESICARDPLIAGEHRWLTPELLVGKLSIPPYLSDAVSSLQDIYSDDAPPSTTGSAGWETQARGVSPHASPSRASLPSDSCRKNTHDP